MSKVNIENHEKLSLSIEWVVLVFKKNNLLQVHEKRKDGKKEKQVPWN